ncbi:MAG: phosphopyruvate hydratase [Candidatus Levybacteria bacterium]|nr:phosphopyruvate hydratase [Candidatus Levybacteria bacterium]
MKIKQIFAREILNSKGFPTVETTVILENGISETSSCPTGTSVSKYEAVELRDNDPQRFNGFGVLKAVNNVLNVIAPKLIGKDVENQAEIDNTLISLDSSSQKSNLGANSILPVSMAVAKTAAKNLNMPLFAYLRHYTSLSNAQFKIPTPAFNIINGGKHAGNNLDFQEFLLIPASSIPYQDALNMVVTIYHYLKKSLKDKGASTLVGDEGGFGPSLRTNRDALIMLSEAIGETGYRISYDVFLGIDASANNFRQDGAYIIKDKEGNLTSEELITVYEGLNEEYNLFYLEDPLSEDDWDGWEKLNNVISKNTVIIGDDLIATNFNRLQTAISKNAIGGVIIKPNQIGTVIEALAVVEAARQYGLKIIVSHRSGETNDDFIADFAVGVGADYAKLGAPTRGERVAKYNRLLEIENLIRGSSG